MIASYHRRAGRRIGQHVLRRGCGLLLAAATGERRDGQVVIRKGLKAGEQIVTAGQLKLDNGARVSLIDDQALTGKANSQPAAN